MAASRQPATWLPAGRYRNEVHLTGRVSADPVERTLPSGDLLLGWRLVVGRPAGTRPGPRASVDTIDCAATRADVRRTVRRWRAGELVEVEGALRRRFWRQPAGVASRYEVEVHRARRVRGERPGR